MVGQGDGYLGVVVNVLSYNYANNVRGKGPGYVLGPGRHPRT